MGLKTFVKVGNITNLSDARYCAGMGVDQLGFNVDRDNENYIDPTTYATIKEWVSGVEFVLEGIPHPEDNYDADKIQQSFPEISPNTDIISIHIDQLSSLTEPMESEYLLIEGPDAEVTAEQLDKIKDLSEQLPITLGFGITSSNVEEISSLPFVKGISMKGSQELRPGFKDYDELADILEALDDDEWA